MNIRKIISLSVIILIAVAGILIYRNYHEYQKASYDGYGDPTHIVELTIEEGETVNQIAQELQELGLIKNTMYFKLFIRQNTLSSSLQAGSFRIPDNLPYTELTETLGHAQRPDVWVTIPEGKMAKEIAEYLEEGFAASNGTSFSKDEFLTFTSEVPPGITAGIEIPDGKPLEGFLFPDTYRFPPDATAEYVINAMLETFTQKQIEYNADALEASDLSLYDTVILASILERETRHGQDRRLVADILLRRLENSWALEVDATLLYHFGDWSYTLTYDDLQLDTPYNTRKYGGMPPTPISNPGQETFQAILNPKANDHWYYISDNDGILHYATTLEEHNANIETYLQ